MLEFIAKNKDENILSGVLFLSRSWLRISISSMLNTLSVVPTWKWKVYSPSTIQTHKPWLAKFTGSLQTINFPGEFDLLYFSLFLFSGIGHPNYQPLSCNDKWINTHHENNPLTVSYLIKEFVWLLLVSKWYKQKPKELVFA